MRKSCLFTIVLLLLGLMVFSAQAVDGLSFNEGCKYKTNQSVTLYEAIDDSTAIYGGRTLPAGTYLRKNGSNKVTEAHPDLTYIVCCPSGDSENRVYGYIKTSAISSATASYTLPSGKTVSIPEALLKNKSALNFYIQMEYGETVSSDIVINDKYDDLPEEDTEKETGLTQAEWAARYSKAVVANGLTFGTVYHSEEGEEIPVSIVELGLARSKVKMDGKTLMVPTADLSWEHNVTENRVLATINAQKQGYAFLRAKKNNKSFIMDHCITNAVVRVINYGKTWCLVDYQGVRGYVHTSALTFHANDKREYQTGVLSYKGRTYSKNGTTTVNIRAKAVNGSRILKNLVVGTPVTVTGVNGKWSEVDCAGFHAFVLTEYIKLDE